MKTIDIVTLAGEFKNQLDLQQYCDQQFLALQKLKDKIIEQQLEIEHLKSLVSSVVPDIGQGPVEQIIVTPEEALLERQIELLREKGLINELTLEDTKKLDLLIRNKRLVQERCTDIQGQAKKLPDKSKFSNKDLMAIAASGDKVE